MPDDSLNTALQYLGAALAGLTVVVGVLAVIVSNRLSKVQEGKVANALADAAHANVRAEKLEGDNLTLRGQIATLETKAAEQQERAARAETLLGEVRNTAGVANRAAGEANERAARLELEAATLHARAADAELETARTKQELSELAKAMQPRRMGTTSVHNEERALFSGTRVFITFAPGDDTEGLAKEIANVLQRSEWVVLGVEEATPEFLLPTSPHISEGVMMLTTTQGGGTSPFDSPAIRAAYVFSEQLYEIEIESRVEVPTTGEAWPHGVPVDALLIKVGPKSERFWMDRLRDVLVKSMPPEMQDRLRQSEDTTRWLEQGDSDRRKRDNERRHRIVEEQRLARERGKP